MVVKWTFLDPTDSSTAQFDINPNEGGSIQYSKNITAHSTLAPGGKTLLFEGAQQAPEITFSGTILTQNMYDMMVLWFNKRHQIQLTDDLGRVMIIYITKFEPKRERARSYPYKHSYSCGATIVDWP